MKRSICLSLAESSMYSCVSVCVCIVMYLYIYIYTYLCVYSCIYGVATISRLPKIIGLFCKRALEKRQHSAKETFDFKEPTNCSHPVVSLEDSTCAKEPYERDYILQKRPMILSSLLIVATP